MRGIQRRERAGVREALPKGHQDYRPSGLVDRTKHLIAPHRREAGPGAHCAGVSYSSALYAQETAVDALVPCSGEASAQYASFPCASFCLANVKLMFPTPCGQRSYGPCNRRWTSGRRGDIPNIRVVAPLAGDRVEV